jgi:hypothetical protein
LNYEYENKTETAKINDRSYLVVCCHWLQDIQHDNTQHIDLIATPA